MKNVNYYLDEDGDIWKVYPNPSQSENTINDPVLCDWIAQVRCIGTDPEESEEWLDEFIEDLRKFNPKHITKKEAFALLL